MTTPLLKWPGGKRRELGAILSALPERPVRLHEPFVGGGAVWLATAPDVPAVVNDASRDLMAFYRAVADGDPGLFDALDALVAAWMTLARAESSTELRVVADALSWAPPAPRSPPRATGSTSGSAIAGWTTTEATAGGPTTAGLIGAGPMTTGPIDTRPSSPVSTSAGSTGTVSTSTASGAAPPTDAGVRAVRRLATAAVAAVLVDARRVRDLAGSERSLTEATAVSVASKVRRARRLQERRGEPLDDDDRVANVVGALHAGLYTAMRARFNTLRRDDAWPAERPALFWAMRELSYAAMFRRNADGDFNVPFGGITYSRKDLGRKVAHLRSAAVTSRLTTTQLRCGDVAEALCDVQPADAVFLDPPYDTDFSLYDGNAFGWDDQVRLEALARGLPCAVVAVLKDTPRIRELWSAGRWSVQAVDHHYAWTIKSRNERRVRHLLIRSLPGATR